MNFFIELFNETKHHFGKKFIIIFFLVLISALLDFFAVISILPIINVLFPNIIAGSEEIINFYKIFFNFFNLQFNSLNLITLIIITFFLVKFIEFFSDYFTFKESQKIKLKVQNNFLTSLKNCYLSFFININTGIITNLYNRELGFAVETYRLLFIITARLVIFTFILFFLLINEFFLTITTLTLIILCILAMKKFYRIIEKNASKFINEQKNISSSFNFLINNIFTIKNSSYENTQLNEIENQTENLIKLSIKNNKYKLIISSFIEPIFIIGMIFAFFLIFKFKSEIPTNYLINLGFLMRFGRHFLNIQSYYIKIINWKRYVESKKFYDNLLKEYSIKSQNAKNKIAKISEILLENLVINYQSKKILNNFNIKIKSPFCIKLEGNNGSGKTTLIRAIMGLTKIDSGAIKFNQINLNSIDKKSLSNKICILDKNPLIMKGSFLQNIKIKENISINKEKVLILIREFDLLDIFNENNLDTMMIEEGGKNLSQGQMQKIAIIRSIINNFEIIIIDEGLSNIDEHNEKKIINYLIKLHKEQSLSLIFISHKKKYNQYFKQIITLQKNENN